MFNYNIACCSKIIINYLIIFFFVGLPSVATREHLLSFYDANNNEAKKPLSKRLPPSSQ